MRTVTSSLCCIKARLDTLLQEHHGYVPYPSVYTLGNVERTSTPRFILSSASPKSVPWCSSAGGAPSPGLAYTRPYQRSSLSSCEAPFFARDRAQRGCGGGDGWRGQDLHSHPIPRPLCGRGPRRRGLPVVLWSTCGTVPIGDAADRCLWAQTKPCRRRVVG